MPTILPRSEDLTPRRLSGDARFVALIVAAVALIFSDVLFLGSGFYVRDVLRDYLPSRFVFRRIVLGGELPLWNPWFSGGQPLAANPGFQAFYPGTWLTLLPDFFWGFHAEVVVHVALAAAGMFALLRTLALRPAAALFGAVAFGLGGAVLSLTNLLPFLTSVAWWPWIVRFEVRVLREGRGAAFFALSLAMLLLAAEQAVMIQTAILVISIAASGAPHPGPLPAGGERVAEGRVRGATRQLLIACVAAVVIASVQLLPAWQLKRVSSRAHDLSYEDAVSWSMPLDRPLELVWPHAFGRITDDGLDYRGRTRYNPPRLPFLFSIYCGIAVPLLVLGGMFTRAPWRWWAATLALLSYALAIGGNGPLVRWLYEIGVWRTIRFPEKFILFGLFAMIVFAAIVVDRLDPRLAALILIITLGDVALHVNELAPRMPRRFFAEVPPMIAAMPGDNRVFHAGAPPLPRAPETYWAERDALPPFLPALYGKREVGEIDINLTNLQPTESFVRAVWTSRNPEPLLAAANVEWIVTPAGPRRIAPRPRYEGGVVAVAERVNAIDIDVRNAAPTLLHLRFTPDPHWRVTIDGKPAALRVADVGFAGVDVPAGTHRVALRYRDPLILICALASILAVMAAIIVAGRV